MWQLKESGEPLDFSAARLYYVAFIAINLFVCYSISKLRLAKQWCAGLFAIICLGMASVHLYGRNSLLRDRV